MKSFIFIVCLSPLLAFQADSLESIARAISVGDAQTLGNYMDENVELAILDEESVYSKSEAIRQMQRFFASNRPANFSKIHQGASKGIGAKYCIGNLQTEVATYRVYIFLDASQTIHKIQELRIEE